MAETRTSPAPARADDGSGRLGAGLARWGGLGLLFALLGLLALAPEAAFAQPAEGAESDEGPAEAPDLFEELLASRGDGAWRGVLNRILETKDATWIGQVLGRLFREPALAAEHAACAAYTAAYLTDHPANGKVLLGAAIVRRAFGDEDFVRALRSHITRGEGGWARLLDEARTLLADEAPASRRVAVWFLGQEVGEQRDRVRRDLVAAAQRDLPRLATGDGRLGAEYLDAFERLLGYRFASLEEAVTRLEELQDLDLSRLILVLSRRKDSPDAPLYEKLVEYGKRLIDDAVTSRDPARLEEFLDPARTAAPQLRRYAMQKAAQMGPQAGAAWGDLLRGVLAREGDATVLQGALVLLERTGFTKVEDVARRISGSLAARLQRHGPTSPRGSDAVEDRLRMARLLGSLGVLSPEFESLLQVDADLEDEVFAELIRSLGGVQGVKAEPLLAQYRRHQGGSPRDRLVTVAVVDALGRPGIRADGGDPDRAGAALREILTGEGEAELGRSEDAEVRQHATRSLGGYPGEATAEVLGRIALGADEQEARLSIVVLGKTAADDEHAVRVLGDVARHAELGPERRTQALRALGNLGNAEGVRREAIRSAVRDVLASEASPEVRLAAAYAAVVLRDPLALGPLLAYWSEDPSPERMAALRELLLAVVADGETNDGHVRATLLGIGQEAGWDLAATLVREAIELAPRPGLRQARAEILLARSRVEGRDLEAARADADEADRLLAAFLGPEPGPESIEGLRLHVQVLRRAGELAPGNATRRDRYLEGVRRALLLDDDLLARLGLELTERLSEPPLAELLDEEQAQSLEAARQALRARTGE